MSVDPAMRNVVGGRAKERTAASTSLMGRFETEILTQPKNMELLKNLSVDSLATSLATSLVGSFKSPKIRAFPWQVLTHAGTTP